jgi:hypothetical protein
MSDPALRRGASVFRIPTVCQALDEEHHLPISRKVYLMGSGFSGIEASSSTFQCKFPPFGAKSAHPSVNLPVAILFSAEQPNPTSPDELLFCYYE